MTLKELTERFDFLDRLSDTNTVRMSAAHPIVQRRFDVNEEDAIATVRAWRSTLARELAPRARAEIWLDVLEKAAA